MKPLHGHVIESARRWALAEFEPMRHGKFPYSVHLVAVAGLVACFTSDENTIAAAWLHDLVEDHREQFDVDDVRQMTNDRVAHLVDLLTDPPGPRELAKLLSLPRVASDPDAVLIKLADRYHNQAASIMENNPRFLKLYVGEFETFDRMLFPVATRHKYGELVHMLETQFDIMSDLLQQSTRTG